jgi:guanine deaminase
LEEQRFSDRSHADAVAKLFFDQLFANGTTTAPNFDLVGQRAVRMVATGILPSPA